jgi:formylglycine-generating enzyme required for sulfatase activity/tRNA A-37 threonylcarbamoyl transferase component Bud32
MALPHPDDRLPTPDHAPQGEPAPAASEAPTLAPAAPPSEARTIPPNQVPEAGGSTEAWLPDSHAAGAAVAAVAVPGYEVLGTLGKGGMGVVYKARQVKLGRLVALKMILHAEHAGEDLRKRFQTEAEAVAALQHPHVVQVYEVGQHEGLPYFSLEFCAGGSLDDQLDGTPWEVRRAAALIETLAEAMQAAHTRGIVHRDLKPANVLLTEDGTPKITDFGLAKRLGVQGPTQTEAVLGTPSYMAPEQAGQQKAVGPAADVYALGAILYELLTGRPPFKAATPLDTMLQVVGEEPVAVRALQPKVPRDLETICHKCLEKGPKKRYGSARELAEDLRRFQAGEPIRARPVGRLERVGKWARRRPALAALLLVTVLGVAGIAWKYLDAERWKSNLRAADPAFRAIVQKYLDKEKEARQEADKAKKARDFLVSIFQLAETDVKGGNVTIRQILADAERRIPVEFADQPDLRGELVSAIGKVRRGIARRTPQAMLLEVRGAVQLHSPAGLRKTAVPQALVNLDDRLSLSADARVQLVFLSDLHKERLKPGREVTIDSKGCQPADAILERDDSVLMTFVRLPKGTFYMGWDGQNQKKGVKTEIKEDFEIAVHDVTQGQWQAVMGDNPSWFSRSGHGRNSIVDVSDEELKLFPVESVSWDDVQEFLKKLNEKERASGYLYRLPTEAEWEYACRGGATSEEECSYLFYLDKPTNDLSSEQANFNGNFPAGKAPKGKYLERPTRVGAYPPNKLGLCDMHGNVWQWCANQIEGGRIRVIRGGCWDVGGSFCRTAIGLPNALAYRYSNLGFRLARVPVRPK